MASSAILDFKVPWTASTDSQPRSNFLDSDTSLRRTPASTNAVPSFKVLGVLAPRLRYTMYSIVV